MTDNSETDHAGLAAVLWDFDGTLADTEPLWVEAEYDLLATLGHQWSDDHARELVGNSLLDSGAYILNAIGRHDLTPEWVVDQLITRVVSKISDDGIPWRAGARELLSELNRADVPCALVSASYRVLLDAALAGLPEDAFAVSVAGDEVVQGKPHPEPYETACRTLGVDARNCIVIEDSATGARSGNASGALVLAVPNMVAVPTAPRRIHLDTLAGLDVAGLRSLLEQINGLP